MQQDHVKKRRKLIRLKDYDYSSPGGYFVTVCSYKRECIFGKIENERVTLNKFGRIVQTVWTDLPNHYPNIKLDAFVIMPNHVHGIIMILETGVGAGLKPAPTNFVSEHYYIVS